MGESHDPGNGKQESQARHHGQAQAHLACDGALMLGESSDEDGEEDNVVDPQHDFQRGQGSQGDPYFRIGKPVQHQRLHS
jgi:hypothetical protein